MEQALFNKVAKALSDPRRFALLERIARECAAPKRGRAEPCRCGECACMTLVEEFAITQATISHHLKELVGAELIAVRRSGKCGYFTFRPDTLDAYQQALAARISPTRKPRKARA